jgi:hypothetical protein
MALEEISIETFLKEVEIDLASPFENELTLKDFPERNSFIVGEKTADHGNESLWKPEDLL